MFRVDGWQLGSYPQTGFADITVTNPNLLEADLGPASPGSLLLLSWLVMTRRESRLAKPPRGKRSTFAQPISSTANKLKACLHRVARERVVPISQRPLQRPQASLEV